MTQTLETVSIKTVYPCCKGEARFIALVDVPRERYTRICPSCGLMWSILRSVGRIYQDGTRLDFLEWEATQ